MTSSNTEIVGREEYLPAVEFSKTLNIIVWQKGLGFFAFASEMLPSDGPCQTTNFFERSGV